jgi:hypothetical protein
MEEFVMVTFVMAKKGHGKTKKLIERCNHAAEVDDGNVVCIEKGTKLFYDINHKVRLIDTTEYNFDNYSCFYGFICGMLAANYDITSIFVDSITKIAGDDYKELARFLGAIKVQAENSNVHIYINATADPAEVPEIVAKYISDEKI